MTPTRLRESGLSQSRLDRIRPFFEEHIAAGRMAYERFRQLLASSVVA